MEPTMGLANTTQFTELLEHQGDNLLHPQVGVLNDLSQGVRDIARSKTSA